MVSSGLAASAGEGVVQEPAGFRMDDYRSPVPATLAGARVVKADAVEAIWKEKRAVFIDVFPKAPKPPNLPAGTVWRDPSHMTLAGAHWLPNVGQGKLSLEQDEYFKTRLETLTGNDKAREVVFFCLRDCWMSWNAAKRALTMGYSNVIWFSDGTDGWQEIGNDLVYNQAVP